MRWAWLILAGWLSACGDPRIGPIALEANPPNLAEWGQISIDGDQLVLGEGVTPYALNAPLFTDYAHKLRTIWMPEGASPATYVEGEVFDFPVGTVITKTFYYPKEGEVVLQSEDKSPVHAQAPLSLTAHSLIETRILVRRDKGWEPASYLWNEDQTEATLKRTGAVVPLTLRDTKLAALVTAEEEREFAYIVPNEAQCASCHADNATTKAIRPIGPRAEQLSGSYRYEEGAMPQLSLWQARGLIETVSMNSPIWPALIDKDASLDARARAYLAANCAHCHNPVGPADTSGLDLSFDQNKATALGTCKLPIAAGSGTGGRRFGIVPGAPEASILTYRMETTKPGAMMPELGRSLVHEEGLALVEGWIAAMDGACG